MSKKSLPHLKTVASLFFTVALSSVVLAQAADLTATKPPTGLKTPPADNGTLSLGSGRGPIEVTADGGLELDQTNKLYIARDNAIVKRGDRTLKGDVITAYYRDIPNSSQTEIWRVVADGNVKLLTPTQSAEGDHAVDDLLDTKAAVLTGKHLKLTTPQDVVTARDSLEWYDDKQLAVARGDALGVRADRRIRADVLTAEVITPKGQSSHISRMDGHGHVFVSRPDQTGTGDKGIYNVDTGIVTLVGNVALNRGESTMVGQYGVMDLQNGISHLTPAPDNRVQAYVVPRDRAASSGGNAINAPTDDIAMQKAQTDPGKAR